MAASDVAPTPSQDVSVPASKRGRKRNDNLPPNRARDVQRAFRARRTAHLQDLEYRVEVLETENYRLRQMLSLPPSDRQPLGRGPTGRDPGKLLPKVGGDAMAMSGSPPDHYSDRSTPSPSSSVSHSHPTWGQQQPQGWPSEHYLGAQMSEDPVSRTSSGSSSPYPHAVNYDYVNQRLPSVAHSRSGSLMLPPSGSPPFPPGATPRDEGGLLGYPSGGFASPGVNNHPSALPPHSHSNATLLLNPPPASSSRMVPNFLNSSPGTTSSYLQRRSVNDLNANGGPSFPQRSGSLGLAMPGPFGSNGARLGLSSPSPIN